MPYVNKGLSTKICALTKKVSGSTITINNQYGDRLLDLKALITATQIGSGDPSPDNVRPIVGVSEVGVNYVDFNQLVQNGNFEDTSDWSPYGISLSASENVGNLRITSGGSHSLSQSMTYVVGHKYLVGLEINGMGNTGDFYFRFGTSVIAIAQHISTADSWLSLTKIVNLTTAPNLNYIFMYFNNFVTDDTLKLKNIVIYDLTQMFGQEKANYIYQLEQNESGSGIALFKSMFYKDYYPYTVGGTKVSIASVNGEPYPNAWVNLGGTYYGGVLDVTSGVFTVTQEVKVCNGTSSDGHWTIDNLYGTSRRFNLSANYYKKGLIIPNCNYLNPVTNFVNNSESIRSHPTDNLIVCLIHADRLSEDSLDGWKEYLSNNNLIFVYPLATPFEVQLTPTEVNFIANQVNTIFADSGDIEAIYKTFTP